MTDSKYGIRNSSIPYIVFCSLVSRHVFPALFRYLWIVITKFFLAQWVANLRKKPCVVKVDHPLDDKVPFRPEMVGIYMDFIPIWITAMSFIRKTLGRRGNRDVAEFLHNLADCYLDAYEVYRRLVSTTRRPAVAANNHFRMIYRVDPHLYCVPSLHVMIVCHAFVKLRDIFVRNGRMDEVRQAFDDVYHEAMSITETVVFVKQHSVNCIPAALYFICRRYPSFTRDEAETFISRLFAENLPADVRQEILQHVRTLYRQFTDQGIEADRQNRDYRLVLVDFLEQYKAHVEY